jgi:hypothetical protein
VSGPRNRQTTGDGIAAAGSAETQKIPAGQNIYLWAISFVAALGGLLFGYDWVVIGGAKPFYEKFFHLTAAAEQGWAMSCALIGCLLGAAISGNLSDRYGRKRLLILAALLFGVSSAGTALANVFSRNDMQIPATLLPAFAESFGGRKSSPRDGKSGSPADSLLEAMVPRPRCTDEIGILSQRSDS